MKDAVHRPKVKYDNLEDDLPKGKNAYDIEKNRAYIKPGMALPPNVPPAGTNEKGSYVLRTTPKSRAGKAFKKK